MFLEKYGSLAPYDEDLKKTIKSGNISALGSDISKKQRTVCTSSCIEEANIGRAISHTDSKDSLHSHSWND